MTTIDYKMEYFRICSITRVKPSPEGYEAWLKLVTEERDKYEENYKKANEKNTDKT